MGQILSTHIGSIESAGYQVVISFREDGEGSSPTKNYSHIDFTDIDGHYNVTDELRAVRADG